MRKHHRALSAPFLATAVLIALAGCTAPATQASSETHTTAPSTAALALTPPPTPTATPTATPRVTPDARSLTDVVIGVEGIDLRFDDGTSEKLAFSGDPGKALERINQATGIQPTETPYVGNPDCGASTAFDYGNGLIVTRADVAVYAPDLPVGPTKFSIAATSEKDAGVAISTATGVTLDQPIASAVANVPSAWVMHDEAEGIQAAIVDTARESDSELGWIDIVGVAIVAEGGVVSTIVSPVGLVYMC